MPEPKLKTLDIRLLSAFGRRMDLNMALYLRLLLQPQGFAFVAIAIAAFVVFDAFNIRHEIGLWPTIVIWAITVPLYYLSFFPLQLVWALGQRHLRFPRLYYPLLSLCVLSIGIAQYTGQLALFRGASYAETVDLRHMTLGACFALVFEAFYWRFVLPTLPVPNARALAGKGPAVGSGSAAKTGGNGRSVIVAGETIALDMVCHISSDEHYLEIAGRNGTRRVRARLGDLVRQTEPADGVQPHRSHWIARRALVSLERGPPSGCDTMVLSCGARIAVARARRDAVCDWIATHRADLADQISV